MEVYRETKGNLVYSLYLREFSSHKSIFVLFDALDVSCVFDLIDPLGSHHRLPLRSWNNIPHIILHDGLIVLHHGIFPYPLTRCLLIIGSLRINYVAHHYNIARESLRYLTFSKTTTGICMSPCLLQSLMSPCKTLPTYYNIFGNINMIWLSSCCSYYIGRVLHCAFFQLLP
jgi:hypothetical protein